MNGLSIIFSIESYLTLSLNWRARTHSIIVSNEAIWVVLIRSFKDSIKYDVVPTEKNIASHLKTSASIERMLVWIFIDKIITIIIINMIYWDTNPRCIIGYHLGRIWYNSHLNIYRVHNFESLVSSSSILEHCRTIKMSSSSGF